MSAPSQISLVIPCWREAARLPDSIATLKAFLATVRWQPEVIFVVEQSEDATLETAQKLCEGWGTVIDSGPQRGKGHAVRTGIQKAQSDVIFYMDADLSTPLEEIPAFLNHLITHPEVDVLIGNRAHAQSLIARRQSLLRQTMGRTFNAVLRWILDLEWKDTQCGFKAFRKSAARRIFSHQQLDGFAFDVEVLLLAQKFELNVADMPVQWKNADGSKVHLVRDSLRMLRDALRVKRMVEQIQ